MITEQDLLNNRWVSTADGYVKLGVTLIKRDDEWECHYTVGTGNVWTMGRKYSTLEELYSHIKQSVVILLSSNYKFLQDLTVKQKRTLKNWIL